MATPARILFQHTAACRTRRDCTRCREVGPVGNRYRAWAAERFEVPPGTPWPCPFGIPLGVAAQDVPVPSPIVAALLRGERVEGAGCEGSPLLTQTLLGVRYSQFPRLWNWLNNWRRPSRGLGDTIEKTLRGLGITWCLEAARIIKPRGGCGGCKGRQAWCNRAFPYSSAVWRDRRRAAYRQLSTLSWKIVYRPRRTKEQHDGQ